MAMLFESQRNGAVIQPQVSDRVAKDVSQYLSRADEGRLFRVARSETRGASVAVGVTIKDGMIVDEDERVLQQAAEQAEQMESQEQAESKADQLAAAKQDIAKRARELAKKAKAISSSQE
jgi:hypothetical protein